MEFVPWEEFGTFFTNFEHTAFRLEVRDRYNMPDEQEGFQLFLQGLPDPDEERSMRPWCEMIQAATSDGKRFERVRVVSEPHTDYIRYEIAGTHLNIDAGEDIRYLPRSRARSLDLPDHDYWMFDSRKVAVLHFDYDDQLLGAEMITDPDVVVQHCYWRDVAWHHAIPHFTYILR
ncbi:DUF6879 family protein [Acrocarpospora sp. B8E8]|uniref:DUF6879 family protein n=1 Tax=Acrocarpospora sp. B8E8 TaxID=3153572 RepID=UPI00325E1D33